MGLDGLLDGGTALLAILEGQVSSLERDLAIFMATPVEVSAKGA